MAVLPASPAWAGAAMSVVVDAPRAVVVGQTRLPGAVQVQNSSTAAESAGPLTLDLVALVPSCGTTGFGDCPAPAADPGVFAVRSTAVGEP
ncbi:MAG: hypothetical protein LC713_01765, partial [Actinobacteria bacterium]|nr:hypothetical protein [Actinomycetota bacterium]